MSPRSLAINAQFPVVWANPQTLHIGFDPPLVILREVQDDLLLVLHQLTTGISESGLRMFAEASGVSNERLDRLLDQLAPVLALTPPRPRRNFVLDAPTLSPLLPVRHSRALASIQSSQALRTQRARHRGKCSSLPTLCQTPGSSRGGCGATPPHSHHLHRPSHHGRAQD